MAAHGEDKRVLVGKTPGRPNAILDSRKLDAHLTLGGCGMRQMQITKQRRPADARWRRRGELVLPPDPRDPDVLRAKQLQGQRRYP